MPSTDCYICGPCKEDEVILFTIDKVALVIGACQECRQSILCYYYRIEELAEMELADAVFDSISNGIEKFSSTDFFAEDGFKSPRWKEMIEEIDLWNRKSIKLRSTILEKLCSFMKHKQSQHY